MEEVKKEKIFLFVDGTNLYAGQLELFGPAKYLDFKLFVRQIEKKLRIELNTIYFYASYSPKAEKPTKKQKQYLKNEALFYKNVRNTSRVVFFKGYRSKTSGKEKEVDVKLAVDIVDFAHQNKYDAIYLFSGDADFMHALKVSEKLRKKISIISLENRIPYRFSFIYQTYVFTFTRSKGKVVTSQKIKIVKLNQGNYFKSLS